MRTDSGTLSDEIRLATIGIIILNFSDKYGQGQGGHLYLCSEELTLPKEVWPLPWATRR